MGKIHVRHLVENAHGFYFQATPKMRAAGIHSEALGKTAGAAIDRAQRLNAEWDRIRRGEEPPKTPPAARGTVARLIQDIRNDPEYRDKAPRTIEELDASLEIVNTRLGEYPIRAINPRRAKMFYAGLRAEGSIHYAAKHFKWFRYLMGYALRLQLIAANPTRAVRVKHPPARRQLWPESSVDAVIATARDMGYASIAVATMICYDTSLRPSDIRGLCWRQFDGESLWVVQAKTGRPHRTPLYPETITALKIHRRAGGVIQHDESPIVRNLRGKPYTKDGLTHVFRDICRAAGIPDDLQFRDIRRTASSERADAGATELELSAGTGHSPKTSAKIIETYNPPNYERAKSAQAKRRRKKIRERRKNAGDGEV